MSRLLRCLAITCSLLVLAPTARAQTDADAGTALDGGPVVSGDGGSAGEGGSDRDNPEGDDHTGRVVTVCHFSSDCTRGFSCVNGRCTWSRYRDAEGGFCGAVSGLLLVGGVFALTRKRKPPRDPPR